jgi:hypothetical protein
VPVGVGTATSPAISPLLSVWIALAGTGFAADANLELLVMVMRSDASG